MVSSAILIGLLTDLDNIFARKTHVINYSPPHSSRASLSFKGKSMEIRIYTAFHLFSIYLICFSQPCKEGGYSEEEGTEDEWLSYLLETAQLVS